MAPPMPQAGAIVAVVALLVLLPAAEAQLGQPWQCAQISSPTWPFMSGTRPQNPSVPLSYCQANAINVNQPSNVLVSHIYIGR